MNKKIWLFLLFFVLAVGAVFAIGLSRRGRSPVSETTQNTSSSVAVGSATDADADNPDVAEERDEEQEYFDQVAENEEKIKEEGNIFPRDSYQIFDGYGFRINEFKRFDSYEEYVSSDYYNPENDDFDDPNHPEELAAKEADIQKPHTLVYVKFTVTNEDRYDKEFSLGQAYIVFAVDGSLNGANVLDSWVHESLITMSRAENWRELDNEKEWWYFHLEPGESVTLELAYLYYAVYYNGETDNIGTRLDFDEEVKNPTWYLRIIGHMYSTPDGVCEIEKIVDSIFIECE